MSSPDNNKVSAGTETVPEIPAEIPAEIPTAIPTAIPAEIPTAIPTEIPAEIPTAIPAEIPTAIPDYKLPTNPEDFLKSVLPTLPNSPEEFLEMISSDPDAGMRKVNVSKNSIALGKKMRKYFRKYIEAKGIDEVHIKVSAGFATYFAETLTIGTPPVPVPNPNIKYFQLCISKPLNTILTTFTTLAINEHEDKFKSKLFYGVVEKIRDVKLKRYRISGDVPSQYYRTLVQNIGQKLINIVKAYMRGGGGLDDIQTTVPDIPAGFGAVESGFLASEKEVAKENPVDDTPEMECLLSIESKNIMEKFFANDVSPYDIREDISVEIMNMVFDIYNDTDVRERVCSTIINPVVLKLITNGAEEIIKALSDKNGIALPLETFYILLDDPYVQRIIRKDRAAILEEAKKLSTIFSQFDSGNKDAYNNGDNSLMEIVGLILKYKDKPPAKPKKSTLSDYVKRAVDFVAGPEPNTKHQAKVSGNTNDGNVEKITNNSENVNSSGGRSSQEYEETPEAKPSEFDLNLDEIVGGGNDKIHTGPADYNIDIIIATIVNETTENISAKLFEKLNVSTLRGHITDFIENVDNRSGFISENDMVNSVYDNIYKCLFESLTDSFRLHLFHTEQMCKKQFVVDMKDNSNNTNFLEQYTSSNEPTWITDTINEVVKHAYSGGGGPDDSLETVKYSGDEPEERNKSVDKSITAVEVSSDEPDEQPPTDDDEEIFDISFKVEDAKGTPSKIPQINSAISTMIMSHLFLIFKNEKTHAMIEPILTEIIGDNMNRLLDANKRIKIPVVAIPIDGPIVNAEAMVVAKPQVAVANAAVVADVKPETKDESVEMTQNAGGVKTSDNTKQHGQSGGGPPTDAPKFKVESEIALLHKNCYVLEVPGMFGSDPPVIVQFLRKTMRQSLLGMISEPSLPLQMCVHFTVFCYLSDYLYTSSRSCKLNTIFNLDALHFQSKYTFQTKYKTVNAEHFIETFKSYYPINNNDINTIKEYSNRMIANNNLLQNGMRILTNATTSIGKGTQKTTTNVKNSVERKSKNLFEKAQNIGQYFSQTKYDVAQKKKEEEDAKSQARFNNAKRNAVHTDAEILYANRKDDSGQKTVRVLQANERLDKKEASAKMAAETNARKVAEADLQNKYKSDKETKQTKDLGSVVEKENQDNTTTSSPEYFTKSTKDTQTKSPLITAERGGAKKTRKNCEVFRTRSGRNTRKLQRT
jgi:hypothetical protein